MRIARMLAQEAAHGTLRRHAVALRRECLDRHHVRVCGELAPREVAVVLLDLAPGAGSGAHREGCTGGVERRDFACQR